MVFPAAAGSVFGYAWSENIGWIKLDGPGYGVEVNDTTGDFSGYAWSPNIGWISFSGPKLNFSSDQVSGSARACAGAANSNSCSGGANPNAGGWDGLIKFSGSNYGVKRIIGPAGCTLEGYVWGATNVGWVKFGGPTYQAVVNACPIKQPPPAVGPINCDFSADPAVLISPRKNTNLSWSCASADSCNISGLGNVDPRSGVINLNVPVTSIFLLSCTNKSGGVFSKALTVTVLKPTYCEIIPNGPGC